MANVSNVKAVRAFYLRITRLVNIKPFWSKKSAITVFALFFISCFAHGAFTLPKVIDPTKAETQVKLEVLNNFKGKNEIKLLNNRFRIDYEVDEIMLLMVRKHGAPPVILVKPDGSKIYFNDEQNPDVKWHADISYDLIQLRNPVPGPWQALGKIEPNSRIMVLSDVQLVVETLPEQVFQSERIKAQAHITNAGSIISDPTISDVVTLKSYLYSTNDADQPNFGASIFTLGAFLDDGRVLDERPRDGKFTVQYDFHSETGVWIPTFRASAELFTREVSHEPIEVLANPISFEVAVAPEGEKYHVVSINVDDTYLEDASLLFQGTITFPNMEVETFHLNKGQTRELQVFQNEYGLFEIKAEVFGVDNNGRDFVLSPKPFTFITEPPEVIAPNDESNVDNAAESIGDNTTEMTLAPFVTPKEPKEEPVNIGLIISLNLLIVLVGLVLIWVVVLKKPLPNPIKMIKSSKKGKTAETSDSESKEKVDKKAPKSEGSDDILDLSLPDD